MSRGERSSDNLLVPSEVMAATTIEELEDHRDRVTRWRSDDLQLMPHMHTPEVLADLVVAAKAVSDTKFARVVEAIIATRTGVKVKTIPSLRAAPAVLYAYLREDMIDGWLYRRESDGHMHPYLVTHIGIMDPMNAEPYVAIGIVAEVPFKENNHSDGSRDSISLQKADVARRSPEAALLAAGYVKETPELKAAYVERLDRFRVVMNDGFGKQFRFTGTPKTDRYQTKNPRKNRKVVHDVKPSELAPLRDMIQSDLIQVGEDEEPGMLPVPVQTIVRVFDLGQHEFWKVNVFDLTDYEYDMSLRDKLILPADQRELLDVLTTDLTAFTSDIIEGKSAGNVVLAKGSPGVGKTLTAEVYAELIQRPLYSIHSGSLGVSAESVRKNLEETFERAQRWNAVLLLDEADVFVLERGNDIVQNAICAEFLRTLEYFDGLLFMTTNRSDHIDDAIISRCAALIDYTVPGADDARRIWEVLAKTMNTTIPKDVLDGLITGLPEASPRDMKMLLRLTLRMAASRGEDLSLALFGQCAMFRGLHLIRKDAA